MKTSCRLVAAATIAALAGTIALAQPAKDAKKPAAPAAKPTNAQPAHAAPEGMPPLPEGWTMEDFQKCMEAGTPGPMHEYLAEGVGTWKGKTKMWMASTAKEPMESECTTVVSPMMDGRFVKVETSGDMAGMGPFNGFGITGFDNVAGKFQNTWIDNCGTAMMVGTGELSSDGKTLTFNSTYTCPITKKPATWRQVERRTGKDSMVLEMYANDVKNGNKEYKVMEISYTRTSPTAAVPTGKN